MSRERPVDAPAAYCHVRSIVNIKKNIRLPLGYVMGIVFLFRANPTFRSILTGSFFVIIGEAIRFISAGTLKKYKGVVSRNGIYSYTRNPLYIGSFLLGVGFCIIGQDILSFMLFLVLFIPVYRRVIRREEAFLFKQYGDEYLDYCQSVPRIMPRKTPDIGYIVKEASKAKSFNNKEGKTLLGIMAVLTMLIVKLITTGVVQG